jgi:hypothetical protein
MKRMDCTVKEAKNLYVDTRSRSVRYKGANKCTRVDGSGRSQCFELRK